MDQSTPYCESVKCDIPRHILVADIQEDEETFIIGSVRFVRAQHHAHLLHAPQVYHVNVYLLRNRRRLQGVPYVVVLGPRAAVHVQVSGGE